MSILMVTVGKDCSRQSLQDVDELPTRQNVHHPFAQ